MKTIQQKQKLKDKIIKSNLQMIFLQFDKTVQKYLKQKKTKTSINQAKFMNRCEQKIFLSITELKSEATYETGNFF